MTKTVHVPSILQKSVTMGYGELTMLQADTVPQAIKLGIGHRGVTGNIPVEQFRRIMMVMGIQI
jgi:hypothetical protein